MAVKSSYAVVFKAINPSKFKNEAFVRAIEAELHRVANDMLLDYELTTATWKHEVKFVKELQVGPNEVAALVGTDDEIYRYVDLGTKRHKIFPRRAKALAFRSIFVPKTTPGSMVAAKGFVGGDTVYRKYVNHPGTKARKFTQTIQREWRKKFKRRMETALKNAVTVSGHKAE